MITLIPSFEAHKYAWCINTLTVASTTPIPNPNHQQPLQGPSPIIGLDSIVCSRQVRLVHQFECGGDVTGVCAQSSNQNLVKEEGVS
jgi:hypothetical protein